MNQTIDIKRLGARFWVMPLALTIALTGCSAQQSTTTDTTATEEAAAEAAADESTEATEEVQETAEATEEATTSTTETFTLTRDDITVNETISDDASESHAIVADGESASYAHIEVTKTGDADGDEADFYGTNAAVFATNGGTLDLTDVIVTANGTHANAVFSYGEGSTVNISNSLIETTGNCSGGIMVTGGGTLNATNLYIHTTGNSSAAIRSDRGGGTENVNGGTYITDGKGSPVVYSTADVNVTGATMTSTSSQGVVVEGQNSVSLTDCVLTASNVSKNSDKSEWYQAVMIYQSMSGDAGEGEASFTMDGGSLTNTNGDVFFVNNTACTISLKGATIVNEDAAGVLLRAAAAGWGNEGSNGGHVVFNLANEQISGDIVVDSVSELNCYLTEGTSYEGAINADNAGAVYVEIESGSTWKLTGDSYVTSLTCDAGAIDLNGHTLYVNGEAYTDGSASTGTAVEFTLSSGNGGGMGGEGGPGGGGEPPAKPGE